MASGRAVGWICAAAGAVLAAGAAAQDRPSFNKRTGLYEPPLTELRRASERGDRAELARWATRLGPARLAEALRGPDRGLVLASLEAAALLAGGVRLVETIAPLVEGGDARVVEQAARTLGQLLDGSEPRRLEDWEIPPDVVARACRGLGAAAARASAPVPARLAAVEALAEASRSCPATDVTPLLKDAAPEVRRAAALALALRDGDEATGALRDALADADPRVAAAAGVAYCRRRLATRFRRGPREPRPLRELATADATPVEDAAEILPCLAATGDAADRKALEELRRGKGVLRERAGEVLEGKGK